MSKKYPCPAKIEDDCGYPTCAHSAQCEKAVKKLLAITPCLRLITQEELENVLIHEGLVESNAIEDPEGYDNGKTELAVTVVAQVLNEIAYDKLKAECFKLTQETPKHHTDDDYVSRLVRFRKLLEMEISEQYSIVDTMDKEKLADFAKRRKEVIKGIVFAKDYFCENFPESLITENEKSPDAGATE